MVENIIKNQETNETLSEDKELEINEKNETSKEITVEDIAKMNKSASSTYNIDKKTT